MEILWAKPGFFSVREVVHSLNERHDKKSAYTTIMTVLSRLHKKRFVQRRLAGRGFVYTASSSKEVFLRTASRDIVEHISRDFGDAAVAYFFDALHDTQLHASHPSSPSKKI